MLARRSGGPGSGRARVSLVHDPLCPLASAAFLAAVRAEAAADPGLSVAAYRPVTDTVKTVVDEVIHGTVDREGLAAIVCARRDRRRRRRGRREAPGERIAPRWVTSPARRVAARARPVGLVKGPSLARRVEDASAVNLLECVDELNRQVRHDEPAGT